MAKKSISQSSPTEEVYGGLQKAFNYFNKRLFAGQLPHCLITMQRHPNSKAYFHGERFQRAHVSDEVKVDEIAMNPMHFEERTQKAILSTLVHEMVHSWQAHHGKEPTRCYHDRQWAAKMKEVGLHPSHTGEPGGKEVGQHMTHYIVDGGPFYLAADEFMANNETALYQDRIRALEQARALRKAIKKKAKEGEEGEGEEGSAEPAPKSKGRAKFLCPGCGLLAWAKPSAQIACIPCKAQLVSEDATSAAAVEGEDDDD